MSGSGVSLLPLNEGVLLSLGKMIRRINIFDSFLGTLYMGETMMRMMIVIVNTLTKALFLSIYLYICLYLLD